MTLVLVMQHVIGVYAFDSVSYSQSLNYSFPRPCFISIYINNVEEPKESLKVDPKRPKSASQMWEQNLNG